MTHSMQLLLIEISNLSKFAEIWEWKMGCPINRGFLLLHKNGSAEHLTVMEDHREECVVEKNIISFPGFCILGSSLPLLRIHPCFILSTLLRVLLQNGANQGLTKKILLLCIRAKISLTLSRDTRNTQIKFRNTQIKSTNTQIGIQKYPNKIQSHAI